MKLQLHFEIIYPLSKKKVKNGRLTIDHLGELVLQGSFDQVGGSITGVNLDFARLGGTNILPVLEHLGVVEDLEDFCLGHAHKFENAKPKEVCNG